MKFFKGFAVPKTLSILWLYLAARDDEEVDWGLGRDVLEGDAMLILVQEFCRNRPIQDLVEYRGLAGGWCGVALPGRGMQAGQGLE